MSVLLECIPNISEGRREQVIEGLARTLRGRDGMALLHTHSDPDHNRTVFTCVGRPEPLLEAVLELFARTVDAIDMNIQSGVHPRVGAVDVCPFVPLPRYGSDMELCIDLANRLGGEVAERFEIPVFLYREAATGPERRELAQVRRGQYEGLRARMADPEWQPDFGPGRPHPTAGASIIGARPILIAYNVVLDRDDLETARAAARKVRASSGGLPGVRALGVPLASRGLAQVSMNIEDPGVTPLHVAVAAVRQEVRARGVGVLETELVGLMPLEAATAAAAVHLQLPELPGGLVLEPAVADALWERPD